MSEDRKHHPFGPSKLQNLEACPHWASLNSDSEKARLGTLQHNVVETGQDDLSLSDDESAAAAECIEFFEMKKRSWPGATELSEIYLSIDDEMVDGFIGTTGGYLDKALIDSTGTKALLADWKFGQWQVESANNNLQGIAYALGVFKAYPKVQHVDFYFKQPHIQSISHAAWTRDDVPALYLRVLTVVGRAQRARELKDFSMASPTVPGCLFCANVALCPAVTSLVLRVGHKYHAVEVPADITPGIVHDPKNSTLGMRLAQLVSTWAYAFRSLTTDRVLRGDAPVPEGYEIAQGAGKRKIIDKDKFRDAALKYVTKEIYDSTVSPHLGAVEEKIKEGAPRGQKDSTVKQFKAELIELGAVEPGRKYPLLKAKSSDDKDVPEV